MNDLEFGVFSCFYVFIIASIVVVALVVSDLYTISLAHAVDVVIAIVALSSSVVDHICESIIVY
jgi:hypothetical protein